MNKAKKILIIDFCNYDDYPIGGYLSFAKNLMISFGNQLSLVGISTDKNDPIGKWFKKSINSIDYDFFAFAYYSKLKTKHIIPDRLVTYLFLKYYRTQILKKDINNVFIQRQEVLEATKNYTFNNICYCFAGLENPLAISKYWYAHHLAEYFEKKFFRSLKCAKLVLASGDETAIQEMILRSNGAIKREAIRQFPSRINTDIYKLIAKKEARIKLNIPDATSIIITTGRLAWLKGWKFMIDSFILYEKVKPGILKLVAGMQCKINFKFPLFLGTGQQFNADSCRGSLGRNRSVCPSFFSFKRFGLRYCLRHQPGAGCIFTFSARPRI